MKKTIIEKNLFNKKSIIKKTLLLKKEKFQFLSITQEKKLTKTARFKTKIFARVN